MRRSLCVLCVLMMFLLGAPAPGQERVLVVGDSWAGGMWRHRTMQGVFASNGRSDITEWGEETALGGTTARGWRQPAGLQLLTDELNLRPSIDTVQLTVGGNDLLAGQAGGGWYAGISAADQQALFARVSGDILTVVDHVLAHSPSMEVLVSLYDYINLEDFSDECLGLQEDLGSPTTRQINEMLNAFQDAVAAAAASRSRVTVIDHRGLMQSTFGFPAEGIPAGTIQPPGDLDRPSPQQAMNDCIHLTSEGLSAVGQNLWRRYYDQRFNGGNDGGGDDPRVRMAASRIEVSEGGVEAKVTVELSGPPNGELTVAYTTAGATASAGEDFEATSGTLTWGTGDGSPRSITVRLFEDSVPEGNESFWVSLGDVGGGTLDAARSATEIVLLDNDGLTTCEPSTNVLCLNEGRFRVEIDWATVNGGSGRGTAQPMTDTSGFFWFFRDDNIEMLFKIVDGCTFQGLEAYWVFFAATTNVQYTLRVTDTASGQLKEYTNPQGMPALPVQDLRTFKACP